MIDLKARFGRTFKVALDESATILGQSAEDRAWLTQVPCQYGHIFIHGAETLGAYCRTIRFRPLMLAIPGVRMHQVGDREFSVIFPPEAFDRVAKLLRAKRRRQVSESERRRLAEMSTLHSPLRHRPDQKTDAPRDSGEGA